MLTVFCKFKIDHGNYVQLRVATHWFQDCFNSQSFSFFISLLWPNMTKRAIKLCFIHYYKNTLFVCLPEVFQNLKTAFNIFIKWKQL